MTMAGLELYVLEGTQDKPVRLTWQLKTSKLQIKTRLKGGIQKSPFLVVFAHGSWPDDISSFKVEVTSSSWSKPLGILDAQSRALYHKLDAACWQPNEDMTLTMTAAMSRKGRGILTDTTSSKSIPNQLADTQQLLDKLERKISPQTFPSTKKRRRTADLKTPEISSHGCEERMRPATRRLRLSEKRESKTPAKEENPRTPCMPTRVKVQRTSAAAKTEDGPSGRWGHAMCHVGPNTMLLVGGQGSNQVISKDALWELNTGTLSWTVPSIEPIPSRPELRTGHTVCFDDVLGLVYVYGGSKNVRWYNDVFSLDVRKNKWSLIEANGKAPTRSYHTSTLFRGEMFVFGGIYPNPNLEPDSCSNDLYIFNSVNKSWYQPIVLGSKPKPRSGHSATLLGDRLVIFGGWDAPHCYNDVHILDLGLMEFTFPDVKGTPPSPRCWHGATALSDSEVLIHGGYDGQDALSDSFVFSLDTLTWQPVTLDGSSPVKARAGHTVCAVPDIGRSAIVFGGGDNEENFFSDVQQVTVKAS